GRPTSVFSLNPKAGTCIGLHVGLSSLRLILADVSHAVLHHDEIELGLDYTPQAAIRKARAAITDAYRRSGLSPHSLLGIGVAVSGPVASDGRFQRASIVPNWSGVAVRDVYASAFGMLV